jgi:hypothetical protein
MKTALPTSVDIPSEWPEGWLASALGAFHKSWPRSRKNRAGLRKHLRQTVMSLVKSAKNAEETD